MPDLIEQYQDGDTEGAWQRARALERDAFTDDHLADVTALATETAVRVSRNVDRLVIKLEQIDFRFAEPERVHVASPSDLNVRLDRVEASLGQLTGDNAPIPVILHSLMERVGSVSLLGSAERWISPTYQFGDLSPGTKAIYADPLELHPLNGLESSVDLFADPDYLEDQAQGGLLPTVTFASDRHSKANHSGGTQEIDWPSWTADPILHDASRHGQPKLTVVQYLRKSFHWGGFPGFADYPDVTPMADIEMLRADLEPI